MIRIDQPKKYDLVSNQIQIAGIAGGAFEGNFNWRISEGHDEVTGCFMAGNGMGGHGQFQITADVSGADFKIARVYIDIYHESAKDGSELDKATVPVVIGNVIMDDYSFYLTHKVEIGDTLWGISEKYYDEGNLWYRLALANRIQPAQIPVGETIKVPYN